MNFFKHLHTINKHRFIVCKLCFKMGLYYQGLTHDLSKYSPIEFMPSVKYFQGNRSPIDAEKKEKGFSNCWLHHFHNNKHHWQFWADFTGGQLIVYDPPLKYVKEMVADRIAACMVYQKDKYHPSSAIEFFHKSVEKQWLHEKTYKRLEYYLQLVADNSLDKAMKIIKNDNSEF